MKASRLLSGFALLSVSALFLAASGCGEAPGLFLQGQLLGAEGSEMAGQPLSGIRMHYRLDLQLQDGSSKTLEFWPETDERGLFFIEDGEASSYKDKIASTRARVALAFTPAETDWSDAVETEAPQLPTADLPTLTRNDAFTLKTPLVFIGVEAVSLRGASPGANTSPAELAASEAQARAGIQAASLIWNQCGIALRPDGYRVADATSTSPLHPATYASINKLRKDFPASSAKTIALIITGLWDRSEASELSLDDSWAYGSLPPPPAPTSTQRLGGVVAESRALGNGALLAHEIGHTLSLLHVDRPETDEIDDTTTETVGANPEAGSNLMFHQILEKNWRLTAGQCARVK